MSDTALITGQEQGVVQLLLELEENQILDAVSMQLTDPDMTYDRWEAIGRFIGRMERSTLWWVGDWLIFGEAVFGEAASQGVEATTTERYSEAERVTGLAHGTLMNVRSVCAAIARPRRRSELGFWIHAEVAKLDPDDQTRWLEEAIQAGLTKQQLREAIRDWYAPPAPAVEDEGAEPEPDGPSLAEREHRVLQLIVQQAQPTSAGDFVVPGEVMAQARAALGED